MKRVALRLTRLLVLPASIALTGCAVTASGRSTLDKDAYRAVFSEVLGRSFHETIANNVCLPALFGVGAMATPTAEVVVDNDFKNVQVPRGRLGQFKALEAAGLVTGVDGERTVNGRTQKNVTFRRTAKGELDYANGTFCYARAELDTIVKWKGPVALGDYQAALVYYTTKTTALAEWARTPDVLAAFPTASAIVEEKTPKVRQVVIDLSSIGWDIAEYSKLIQLE